VCLSEAQSDSELYSEYSKKTFTFARCGKCGFGWVTNPRTDYSNIYDKDYYDGNGVDPVIKFSYEVGSPKSKDDFFYQNLRNFEYIGWYEILRKIKDNNKLVEFRVLDFGGGLGGLTSYLNSKGIKTDLFDIGYGFEKAKEMGVSTISGSEIDYNNYDVVISLQVIEHLIDPLESFQLMTHFLKPNGRIISDTGNLKRHKGKISTWFYARHPEVHVAFWTPQAMAEIGKKLNLNWEKIEYDPRIIQYKILHNLRISRKVINLSIKFCFLWSPVAILADKIFGVSKIGILRQTER
jgi:SAM-dependent methyltransferase